MGDERIRRAEIAWLAGVLVIAAGLRLWRLEANGFGSEYYAAGVRSMLQGLHLFLYNAFDPAGFLSLDKPPVVFWIQTIFARVLGFNGWTLHLPQVLAGLGSVVLIWRLVRRSHGPAAGLLAALLLALSPIAVAIDRSNNTDSWLVFFMLLAALVAVRGRGLSLVVAMALLGVAFNVKMLAAWVCGPALLGVWFFSGTMDWRRRLGWMMAAGATLVVVSLAWAAVFDLTPREDRPYAGSSNDNSMLELAVVHNGLERFTLTQRRPSTAQALGMPPGIKLYDAVPVGPLRLANPMLAGQFAWLLPLAVLAILLVRRRDREASRAALALWGLWALAYGTVYSLAGGIFHIYYLATLAPPLSALAAIGARQLWRRGPAYLAVALGLAAAWQIYLTGSTLDWTAPWLGFPLVALAAGIATLWRGKRPPAAIGGAALMVLPIAWALSPIFSPGALALPSASLPRWLGLDDGRGPILSKEYISFSRDPKLHAFLLANRGNERFLVVTPNVRLAAPIIIATGQPVMAVGGYIGTDPILTVEQFAEKVANGEVRYALLGGSRRGGSMNDWIKLNGKIVDDSLWRSYVSDWWAPLRLYDLKPR